MTTAAYNQESQMMRVTGANILNLERTLDKMLKTITYRREGGD